MFLPVGELLKTNTLIPLSIHFHLPSPRLHSRALPLPFPLFLPCILYLFLPLPSLQCSSVSIVDTLALLTYFTALTVIGQSRYWLLSSSGVVHKGRLQIIGPICFPIPCPLLSECCLLHPPPDCGRSNLAMCSKAWKCSLIAGPVMGGSIQNALK